MKLLIGILVTAGLVLLIAHLSPGVQVAGFTSALIVAVVLALLNMIVKPVIVMLTLPLTIITFGLFLLVINTLIVLLCANMVDGFRVDSFWIALFFSIILSALQSITFAIMGGDK